MGNLPQLGYLEEPLMDYWARPPERRDQLVLFPTRLDDLISANDAVRLFDEILNRLDWSEWEAAYDLQRGQPPIHPRILAGLLLYGLLKRVRSTRALEEALKIRVDFRWLAEGREIDHTTLSKFRLQHKAALRKLFVQVGLIAREAGFVPLEQLAFDGTRVRANNRRSGTRTPAELRASREELQRKYSELEARWSEAEARDEVLASDVQLPQELEDTAHRLAVLEAALAELERAETAGETIPKRIPVTDPQSRVSPNKDGGFAPNYTPMVTVDTQDGFIVGCEVIAQANEDPLLVPQVQTVQQDFGLASPPSEMLADGLMCSGDNLQQLQALEIDLYSPSKLGNPATNPAHRADLRQAVPEAQWDQLPTQKVSSGKGQPQQSQLAKEAFVYDAEQDCYWCPVGQSLSRTSTCQEKLKTGSQERRRYTSESSLCAECPLRSRCLKPGTDQREVNRYQHDGLQEALAQRMSTAEAQAKYARRRHVAERPFAMLKQHYGARQFLLRGLDRVREEWRWLATAFNLGRLMSLLQQRAGPP